MKIFKHIVLLMILAGCGKDFEFTNKDSDPNDSNQVKVLYQEDVSLAVEPDAEAYKYWVRISWPKSIGSITILENGKRLYKSTSNHYKYERLYISGEKLEISLIQEESEPFFSKRIEIPEDLIISKSQTLSEDFKFKGGRLFMTGTAKIQSLQFNVNIDVDEFVSENAMIETYPANQKAKMEISGRSGGIISIKSLKSSGKLFVVLRGEDGGDGKSSVCHKSFTMLCNASSAGHGGNFGQFTFESNDSRDFELNLSRIPGVGGTGGIACLYPINAPPSLQPGTFINLPNNCEGNGAGLNNGQGGVSGSGEVCLKFNEEDRNVCN